MINVRMQFHLLRSCVRCYFSSEVGVCARFCACAKMLSEAPKREKEGDRNWLCSLPSTCCVITSFVRVCFTISVRKQIMDRFLKRPSKDAVEEEAPKKKKNTQKFRDEYKKLWPCLVPGKEGYAHCTVCNTEFSVEHGGRNDCQRHVTGPKHVALQKNQFNQQSVDSFFTKRDEELDVIKAETLFVRFLVEHNIPLSVADHAAPLFSRMFPDSEIAKKFHCGHTKANAIANTIAETDKEKTIDKLRDNSFALATDGSNDIEASKLYPLVVSFYDEDKGMVVTTLLSLLQTSDNTGEGIFKLLNSELRKFNIKWSNCVSFCSDNASTMTGRFKGVSSFILNKNPNIKMIGCPCHLIHLAAQKATNSLPIDVEAMLVQLYYYLDKSSKRKNSLKECQNLCGEKSHKILKHVNTRWLSLENSLKRVIEQWESLQKFFSNEFDAGKKNDNFLKIQKMIYSPTTKLYCLFISSALPSFTKVNLILQKEQPCVHILHEQINDLFFELLVRFVTPSAISKSEEVLGIEFAKRKNQKHDDELVIGSLTRAYLKESLLSENEVDEFYSSVRNFYSTACEYIKKKFPLQDEFFKHASIGNINSRKTASFASVKYFTNLFKCCEDSDSLELEFARYQSDIFSPEILNSTRIDDAWHKIRQLKNIYGVSKYPNLSKLMLTLLVIPHGNAPTERLFSMVRKNQTSMRSTMSLKTLESLLISKLNMTYCYNKVFTVEELKKAKSACYKLNQK